MSKKQAENRSAIYKLSHLIDSFNKQELQQFHKFLASPLYNESNQLIEAYTVIRKLPSKKRTLVRIHQKLFNTTIPQDDEKSAQRIRKIAHDLLVKGYDFLTYRAFIDQPETLRTARYLLPELVQRQLRKSFVSSFYKLESQLALLKIADEDYFQAKYWYALMYNEFQSTEQLQLEEHMTPALLAPLDNAYFLRKLNMACQILNNRLFQDDGVSVSFAQEIIAYLDTKRDLPPAIELYMALFRLFENSGRAPELMGFEQLKKQLYQHQGQIASKDLSTIAFLMLNYLIRMNRLQGNTLTKDLFRFYSYCMKNHWLLEHGRLSPRHYLNYCRMALRNNAFAKAAEFVEATKELLPEKFKQDYYDYARGLIAFDRNNFDLAIDCFDALQSREAFKDTLTHQAIRSMLFKCYYERDDGRGALFLESVLNNWKESLKHLPYWEHDRMMRIKNRIAFYKQLVRAETDTQLKGLMDAVNQQEQIDEKDWLLQKIGERIK